MNNTYLEEDLLYIANSIPQVFYNKTIFVTGGTGLIGSLLIKACLYANSLLNSNIKIVAIVRNEKKVSEVFVDYFDDNNITFIYGDIINEIIYSGKIDYIIHGASQTASKQMVENPVETIKTSLFGTSRLLDFAREKKVKGVVYLSSMEVFGQCNNSETRLSEEELGYIDIHNVRSCYSEGKRMCECMCASYAKEYGIPVKIARLAQIFGTGIPKTDNRVFAQFVRSAKNGEDIILHSDGTSWGNYCYTSDAIAAIFTILEKGQSGEAYTVVNESTSTQIKDMASLVIETLSNGQSKLIFDIPENSAVYGYAPKTVMKLSSKKLESLGWAPHISLKEAYLRLANWL